MSEFDKDEIFISKKILIQGNSYYDDAFHMWAELYGPGKDNLYQWDKAVSECAKKMGYTMTRK